MYGRLSSYIEHLHTKSEADRLVYAGVGAVVVAGALFLVWVVFFFANLGTRSVVMLSGEQETVPKSQTTQDTVDSIIDGTADITPESPAAPTKAPAAPAPTKKDPLDGLLQAPTI